MKRLATLLAATAAPIIANAQDQEPIELDELVVSGGLTPVDAQSYARAVTIVTEEELERRRPRTFADALRTVPGVSVSRSGGPGGLTQIRIRGSEANHVLVLIDGVETPNSSAGRDFSTLSPELIERIEVLRGPQSALYGAGATAGVINIITKRGVRGETRVSGSAEGSTAPGGKATGLLQAGTANADIAIGASFSDDAGWDVSDDGGEKDGARDLTLNVRGGAELTEIFSLRGSLRYVDREGEFDSIVGTFGCGGPDCYVVDARGFETESQLLIGGLAADLDTFDGAFVITPSLGYASEDSQTRDTGVSNNDSSTVNIGLQGALTFGAQDAHTLVGALQWKRETFESESAFSSVDESREQFGYVLDYRGDLTDALFVQGGLRFDDNDGFDDFLSWSASASYRFFSTGTRLRGSVGRAQTNPDFFQQFGSTATFIPNPDLKPERNFGWDVGVDQTFWSGRAEIGATYFNETLEDEIATTFGPPPDFIATPVNVDGDSDRQGVELSFRVAPIEGLSIGANYTYLDASEPSNGATAVEVRRPRHSGAVDAFYTFLGGRATIGGEAVWAAGGKDLNFGDPSATSPRADLDDYVVVNITGSYAINEAVELYGGVRNLFDTDYQEVLGYAEQPLTAFAGLRAAF